MTCGSDIRERILAVERILNDHPQTVREISQRLEREYDIKCDRKVIYQDIYALSRYMPIMKSRTGYYLQKVAQ